LNILIPVYCHLACVQPSECWHASSQVRSSRTPLPTFPQERSQSGDVLETDAFTGQGGAAGLTGLSGSEDVTFTTLGLRAAQRWVVGATTALTLRGTLGWQHAFGDTTPSAAFLFAGGSLPFTVAGVPIAEDALVVKAGADLDIGPAVTLGVAYSAQFAQDAQDQQVKGMLNVKF
jgi:outer membrane autotransporter protein